MHTSGFQSRTLNDFWICEVVKLKALLAAIPDKKPAAGEVPAAAKPPQEKRSSAIKIAAYRIGHHIRKQPKSIQKIFFDGVLTKNPRINENINIFHVVLVALNDELSKSISEDYIKRSEIHKYANQLLYADKHKIDEALLIGFLYQIGTEKTISEKIRLNDLEPWFAGYKERMRL